MVGTLHILWSGQLPHWSLHGVVLGITGCFTVEKYEEQASNAFKGVEADGFWLSTIVGHEDMKIAGGVLSEYYTLHIHHFVIPEYENRKEGAGFGSGASPDSALKLFVYDWVVRALAEELDCDVDLISR